MSGIGQITAFDGASTPVVHNLVAVSVSRDSKGKVTAFWREQLPSIPEDAQVRVSMSMETLPSGVVKPELITVVPVQEVVTGSNAAGYSAAPKVAYTDTYRTQGLHHPRSTITGRRLARCLHTNISNGITTSVAVITAGPAPELFDQHVAPT